MYFTKHHISISSCLNFVILQNKLKNNCVNYVQNFLWLSTQVFPVPCTNINKCYLVTSNLALITFVKDVDPWVVHGISIALDSWFLVYISAKILQTLHIENVLCFLVWLLIFFFKNRCRNVCDSVFDNETYGFYIHQSIIGSLEPIEFYQFLKLKYFIYI